MAEPHWAAVDRAPDPDRMIAGLDRLRADSFFAASKRRMAALVPSSHARIVDVGCGTAEDAVSALGRGRLVVGVEAPPHRTHAGRSRAHRRWKGEFQ
jgi:hypothetical protein